MRTKIPNILTFVALKEGTLMKKKPRKKKIVMCLTVLAKARDFNLFEKV